MATSIFILVFVGLILFTLYPIETKELLDELGL